MRTSGNARTSVLALVALAATAGAPVATAAQVTGPWGVAPADRTRPAILLVTRGGPDTGPNIADFKRPSRDPIIFRRQLEMGLQYQVQALAQLNAGGASAAHAAHDLSVEGYKLIRYAENGIDAKVFRDKRAAKDSGILLRKSVEKLELARKHNREAIHELKKVATLVEPTVKTNIRTVGKPREEAQPVEAPMGKDRPSKHSAGRAAQEDRHLTVAMQNLEVVVRLCREVLAMIY